MSTTHNPESIRGLGSLTKLAAPIVLAVALSVAVIGLGAGTASAQPIQVNCPASVPAGHPFGVTLAGWPEGGSLRGWLDTNYSANNPLAFEIANIDKNLATATLFYEHVPALPAGHHNLVVEESMPAPGYNIFQTGCDFDVT